MYWPQRARIGLALALAAAFTAAAPWARAAPSITNLSLRGLPIGQPTLLVIDGDELGGNPRIVLPVAIAAQEVKDAKNPKKITLDITVDPSAVPGIYQLRVASENGISNAAAVGIDHLPQQPFGPELAGLPAALSGRLSGSAILRTTLAGKKGEPLVVDVESRRLGGALNPVVRLYNEKGSQVAYSPPRYAIGGDARLAVRLPADGRYTIELHDFLYRGAEPGIFRMKVGDLRYADMVYPLAVTAGRETPLGFLATNFAENVRSKRNRRARRRKCSPRRWASAGGSPRRGKKTRTWCPSRRAPSCGSKRGQGGTVRPSTAW
jgi:hypothetical protein